MEIDISHNKNKILNLSLLFKAVIGRSAMRINKNFEIVCIFWQKLNNQSAGANEENTCLARNTINISTLFVNTTASQESRSLFICCQQNEAREIKQIMNVVMIPKVNSN